MKKELEAVLEWISTLAKKYGILIMLCLVCWLGIKKAWFWIVLPILFCYFLKEVLILGLPPSRLSHVISGVSYRDILIAWLFCFSIAKAVLGVIIEN